MYENEEYGMSASCEAVGDGMVVRFDLGSYTGTLVLRMSLWTGERFMSYEVLDLEEPRLERDGSEAWARVETLAGDTRWHLVGYPHGVPRTVLMQGYADCTTDDDPRPPPDPFAAAGHPEMYVNERYGMSAWCATEEDYAVIRIDLGSYDGALGLELSRWDGEVFRRYVWEPSEGLSSDGNGGAQVRVNGASGDPSRIRFRLIGYPYGVPRVNLLAGYADCHTDDPEPEESPTPRVMGYPVSYLNWEYWMSVTCAPVGEDMLLTFDLGSYEGNLAVALSLWDGDAFYSYEALDIGLPPLEREGQILRVRVSTDPVVTRFALIGYPHGVPRTNLLLGYADCWREEGS